MDRSSEDLRNLPLEELLESLRRSTPAEASAYAQELIRRFEPLLRHAWQRGALHIDYEDFVQDAFVKLFRGLPSLRNPRAFPGYFRRVALGVSASHFRHRPPESSGLDTLPDEVARFDEALQTELFVRSCLDELPSREREVAILAFLEDLSAEEISRRTGISASAVRATKSRASRHLRALLLRGAEALEKDLDDEGEAF